MTVERRSAAPSERKTPPCMRVVVVVAMLGATLLGGAGTDALDMELESPCMVCDDDGVSDVACGSCHSPVCRMGGIFESPALAPAARRGATTASDETQEAAASARNVAVANALEVLRRHNVSLPQVATAMRRGSERPRHAGPEARRSPPKAEQEVRNASDSSRRRTRW